jgi:hypothetical protein
VSRQPAQVVENKGMSLDTLGCEGIKPPSAGLRPHTADVGNKEQILRTFVPEKVLLSADLRILPEPLRCGFFLALTGFHLLLPGWRGYFLTRLGLVWIANIYMSI